MKKLASERGELNILLVPVILLTVLFVGAASFGVWAFMGRQDYKNNVDQKIVEAVAENKKVVQAEDAQKFAEAAKQPLKPFSGPDQYGGVRISYPKTWSAYVLTKETGGGNPLDAYFNPDTVPNADDRNSTFALRIQVVEQSYSTVLSQMASYIKQGKTTTAPYKLPKVQEVVGTRVEGQLSTNKQGSMVILPLRDKTLKIWTESSSFKADLDNNILPNTTFSP